MTNSKSGVHRRPVLRPDGKYYHRTKIIDPKDRTEDEHEAAAREFPESETHWRPKTRGDCVNGVRPCPYAGCAHHLYLDVLENGKIRINYPDLEGPEEMEETCALDLAERGGISLEEVGELMSIARERARQIETQGLHKLYRDAASAKIVRDLLEGR